MKKTFSLPHWSTVSTKRSVLTQLLLLILLALLVAQSRQGSGTEAPTAAPSVLGPQNDPIGAKTVTFNGAKGAPCKACTWKFEFLLLEKLS